MRWIRTVGVLGWRREDVSTIEGKKPVGVAAAKPKGEEDEEKQNGRFHVSSL
jgi:hypothetical protein